MIVEGALRAIAATLPPGVRDRYREEWLADAGHAGEFDIRPVSLLRGAVGVAASIDRDDPVVAGVDPKQLAFRRMRIAAATGSTALLLLIAAFLAGAEGTAASAMLLSAAAVLLVTVAAVLGAIRAGSRARGRRMTARALILGVLAGLVLVAMLAFAPFLAVPLLGGAAFAAVLLLVIADPRPQGAPASRPRAVGLTVLSGAAILGALAVSLVHIYAWNPRAKLPGMTLDEIYAGLEAAGEMPSAVLPIVAVGFWVLIVLAAVVLAALPSPGVRRLVTVRRILGFGLLGVGLVGVSSFLLGVGMGMGIADVFLTDGGDATGIGTGISLAGVAALIAAAFVGLLPARIRTVGSAAAS